MRKSLGIFVAALVLSVSAATAHAETYQRPAGFEPNNPTWLQEWNEWIDQFGQEFAQWIDSLLGIPYSGQGGNGGNGSVAAPEFDPAEALAALTLLSGGLAVLRGRRAKR
jgi:hypothetical protein